MSTFRVLVIKDVLGNLFHMRMDRPFERYLAQLLVNRSDINSDESPRELANLWIEDMTQEEYDNIDGESVIVAKLPHFVTSNPKGG